MTEEPTLLDLTLQQLSPITTFAELTEAHRVWHVDAISKKIQEWDFLSGGAPRGPHDHFNYRPVEWSYTDRAFYSDVGIGPSVMPHTKDNRLFRTRIAAEEYVEALKAIAKIDRMKRARRKLERQVA